MEKIVVQSAPKVIVVVDGVDYPLRKSTIGDAIEFEEQIELAKENKKSVTKTVIAFVVKMGLPEKVTMGMAVSELEQIVEALHPSKKK